MALRGKKSVGLSATSSTSVALLFLLPAFFFSVAGSTTSAFGLCFSEIQACQGDAECANCIYDWGPANSDSSECTYYAVVAASTTSTSCASDGVRNCCYFEDGTADTCMQNDLMIEYCMNLYFEEEMSPNCISRGSYCTEVPREAPRPGSCIMESNGCVVDDMPCYGTTTSSTSAELDISVTDDTDSSTRKTLGTFVSVLVTTVAALGLAV